MKSMFKHLFTFSITLGLGIASFSGCDDNKNAPTETACAEATKKLGDQLGQANSDLAKAKTQAAELQAKYDLAQAELKAAKEQLAKAAPTPPTDNKGEPAKTEPSADPTKPADAAKTEPAKAEPSTPDAAKTDSAKAPEPAKDADKK